MNRFKKGENVVCIENTLYVDRLTINKIYTVIENDRYIGSMMIVDDVNSQHIFPNQYFDELRKHRGLIIDDILK